MSEKFIRFDLPQTQELNDIFGILQENPENTYIVGADIRDYIPSLEDLGFKNYWTINIEELVPFAKKFEDEVFEHAKLMYAYIDYVVQNNGNVVIFLNQEKEYLSSEHTYFEIYRALEYKKAGYPSIYFVEGLYDRTQTTVIPKKW